MPEAATLPRPGLFSRAQTPVPLTGVSVEADISNLCARVSVAQRFLNQEDKPIEAVYVFPLDEGAAVCGFEAVIDGTLVVGEVKEREEAYRAYDDAMERGDGAYLLDEERPDVFQASVGNLPPGKEVLLRLTYVTELSVDAGSLRFVVPTTVSPRYAPAEDRVGVGRPDSETLNPPVAWRVPYGLELTARLSMTGAVGRIESPSHPVSVAMNGQCATVRLAQRNAALDRDFVLVVDAAGLEAPQACLERDGDGNEAIVLAFAPKLPDTIAPAEVVFVVDRSGSMGGPSIEEVRNALQLCLRSMVPGCRFNIIGFGSTTEPLFRESREYDDASLREASEHVSTLQANLGGTEILPALQLALGAPRHPSLARQIVVLTDGQVSNTDAVLALARQHAADARIFTFGIGAGASHHLVKGLARAGGGAAEFIHPGERIEPKVVRQFGRLLSPALTNVRIDWGGLPVIQAPSSVPPVFGGGRLLIYGFLRTGSKEVATVRLTMDSPRGPVAFEVPVDPAGASSGRVVSTLAARARIRELEESPEFLATRGSKQTGRKAAQATREIVELGIRYGLASRETSYVAIERRATPVTGDVQLRRVPIALTAGWGGLAEGIVDGSVSHHRLLLGSVPITGRDTGVFSMDWAAEALRVESPARTTARFTTALFRKVGPAPRPSAAEDAMHALIALQRADGSWELTDDLARAVGCRLGELEAALSGAPGGPDMVRAAWATTLALAWLELHAADSKDEWRLLANKARSWLAGAMSAGAGGDSLVRLAGRFVH
jgi:Ca-activated chloride channel family protein